MTPNEIYALKPIRITGDLHHLEPHFQDENIYFWTINQKDDEILDEIDLRYYADYCCDGERTFELFSVWYHNVPVMICQQAGRGGRDHRTEFITDKVAYKKLVEGLHKLCDVAEPDLPIVDPNLNYDELTEFYNMSLHDVYDANLKPKYKIGDIVIVNAPVNHLHYMKNERIPSRVQIERLNEMNPLTTYWGMQLDRRWERAEEAALHAEDHKGSQIIFDKDNGSIGCTFRDQDVNETITEHDYWRQFLVS